MVTLFGNDFIFVSNLMKFSTRRLFALKRSWFTLREILVVVVIVSIWLLSVVVVLTNGMKYIQKTRQKVVALNLAREGMEAVYQIRDTNRTRWAWVQDQCWLKKDPLVDEFASRCGDDERIWTGSYVLTRVFTWEQTYFALRGPFTWLDLSLGLDPDVLQFSLCQQSWFRNACMGTDLVSSEWRYFREILGLWLYQKDISVTWGQNLLCTWWLSVGCGDERAKEFRFCSRVVYVGDGTGEVKLCWVLTNFKGK